MLCCISSFPLILILTNESGDRLLVLKGHFSDSLVWTMLFFWTLEILSSWLYWSIGFGSICLKRSLVVIESLWNGFRLFKDYRELMVFYTAWDSVITGRTSNPSPSFIALWFFVKYKSLLFCFDNFCLSISFLFKFFWVFSLPFKIDPYDCECNCIENRSITMFSSKSLLADKNCPIGKLIDSFSEIVSLF